MDGSAEVASSKSRSSLARREFDLAKRWLPINRSKSERHARRALKLGAEAYWYAELTEYAEREHRTLHAMGRWTVANFDCWLTCENGQYSNPCPVSIADVRIGLSPGFVSRKMCSICDSDLSECPHRRDRLYWVRGTKHSDGRCRVCTHDDCKHRDDRVYRAAVIGIVKEVDELHEMSLVDVPAQPLARLTSRPVDTADLAAALGADFTPGVEVECTRCRLPYPGLPAVRSDQDSSHT